ncbi:MAG TPA: PEGA domain-containing protein [Candidatus Saccharimonadales bacterium]|nr:PEGA domain-containing protein [Candidatus Saccharimonadales bacterium]
MDYLDPKKQRQHRIILFTGYICIAVGIVIATLVLVYQAYGYGLKNGAVIQNGLLFVSSQPRGAKIYLNRKLNKSSTNARLILPAGRYQLKLTRDGYRTWERSVDLLGGTVRHFDYPFLVPTQLSPAQLPGDEYASAPSLSSQSPDRRWWLVQEPTDPLSFDTYDLKNPTKAPVAVTLPKAVVTTSPSSTWQAVDWADDNNHLLLLHTMDDKSEYILLDRSDPGQSVNLTRTLELPADTTLTLNNKKYDQYYILDAAARLSTASLKNITAVPLLSDVLKYQSYGNNTVLYVTASGAPAGKVMLKMQVGDTSYDLHSLPASNTYLLNLTTYSGVLYVAAGAASESKVYIYKDPVGQLKSQSGNTTVTPIQVLHVTAPNYLGFSDNAQFIVAEGGTDFGVYDILNEVGFNYDTHAALDAPQVHAAWMDGDRLIYVSGGKLLMFDYDHTNVQTLVPAAAATLPVFAPDFKHVYSVVPDSDSAAPAGSVAISQTSMLTPADQ